MSDVVQTIRARIEVDGAAYSAGMQKAASTTRKTAAEIEAAGRRVDKAHAGTGKAAQASAAAQEAAGQRVVRMGQKMETAVTRAQAGLSRAQQASARAQASYLTSQSALSTAVKRHGASSAQAQAASLRLTAAQQRVAATATEATAAESALSTAQERLAATTTTAATAATGMAGKLRSLGNLNATQLSSINTLSGGMLKAGAVFTATAAGAAGAAIQWENAWAGVTKTVDGTPEQMDQLEKSLRGMSRQLPAANTEIAEVAENAGQLGVATKDVAGFTKTMIDLGVSTNLTADEAATDIAQISNVMGTMSKGGSEAVSRFGATLVDLGNNGASTEKDILSMAQRMAGAMAAVGGSETDLLAVSNALSSMGVQAELGGGVMTRVLLGMGNAVTDGGAKLEAFAKTAGVTSEEFKTLFDESPAKALDAVAAGLAKTTAEGKSATAALDDMGLKGTYNRQVMLALASGHDVLTDSIGRGEQAWKDNLALVQEANKRYETATSKIKIAWNQIKDGAIDAGAAILPTVASITGGIGDIMTAFGKLPSGAKSAIGMGTMFVGGAALLIGAAGKAVTSLNNMKTALAGLNISKSAMGIAGGVAGAALAAGAVGVSLWAQKVQEAKERTAEFKGTLDAVGNVTNDTLAQINANLSKDYTNWFDRMFGKGATSRIDDAKKFGLEAKDLTGYIIGEGDAVKRVNEALDGYITQHQGAGSSTRRAWETTDQFRSILDEQAGSLTDAQKQAIQLQQANDATGASADGAAKKTQTLAENQAKEEAAAQAAAEAENAHAASMGQLSYDADGAARSLSQVYDEMTKVANAAVARENAELGYYDSIRQAQETATANANKGADASKKAGAENKRALLGVASATIEYATAAGNVVESNKRMSAGRDQFLALAKAMGVPKQEAIDLADELHLIPDEVYVAFDSNAPDMKATLTEIWGMVKNAPDGSITIDENSPQVIASLEALGMDVKRLPDGTIRVSADPKTLGKAKGDIKKVADAKYQAKIEANIKEEKAKKKLDGLKNKLLGGQGNGWSVRVDADTKPAEKKMAATASKKRKATPLATSADNGADKDLAADAGKKRTAPPVHSSSDGGAGKQLDKEAGKKRSSTVVGKALTGDAEYDLNYLARARTASVTVAVAIQRSITTINHQINKAIQSAGGNAKTSAQMKAHGGKLRGHADGYRLPTTGPGTSEVDGFTAIDGDGRPLARVDAGEWIINRCSSSGFDRTLAHINAGDRRGALDSLLAGYADGGQLPGYASGRRPTSTYGGRYSWSKGQTWLAGVYMSNAKRSLATQKAQLKDAERQEKAAQKRLDKAKSRSAKARAKAAVKRAQARVKKNEREVKAADARVEKWRDQRQRNRERQSRLYQATFDARRMLYRGTMRDQYGAGNYAGVDSLFDLSNNTDLSKYRRSQARSLAYSQERQVKALTRQTDRLAASMEKATAKRDELLSVRDSVRSGIIGSFDLGSLTGQKDQWGYNQFSGKRGILSYAKQKASGAKKLSGRLNKLQKLGFPSDLLQQVVDEWTGAGTFEIADALLSMSSRERASLKSSYKTVENYGRYAGQHVTEAMYRGGYNAAVGVVKGLESQQKRVEAAFAKLARQGEAAFRKALGIKSPSRVMMANAGHVVAGLTRGIAQQQPAAAQAMRDLAQSQSQAYTAAITAPRYTMPASAEVARYAASQGGSAYVTRDELRGVIVEAMAGVTLNANVGIDNRNAARVVQVGTRYGRNNK